MSLTSHRAVSFTLEGRTSWRDNLGMWIDPNSWPGPKKASLNVELPRVNWLAVLLVVAGVGVGVLIGWLLDLLS